MHIEDCISQEDLNDIAMRFGSVLEVLTISHEVSSSSLKEFYLAPIYECTGMLTALATFLYAPQVLAGDFLLSFRNLHFPELLELTLNGPSIKAIDFTIHNTPKLRSLNVANSKAMRYFSKYCFMVDLLPLG